MAIMILYEDPDLLVIDKPVGVIVNRAETVKEPTVQDWIERELKIKNVELRIADEEFIKRSGIVHRIDKETSGCLIIAKNPESFYKLQSTFKERRVKKEYVALVHEQLLPKTGEITAPIGRLPWNRQRFGVVPGGKEAHTRYAVENFYQDAQKNAYSFVHLFPSTGRTHQLRVHLKYLGFPIVGDYLYAGRKRRTRDRQWCPRVFLHAARISFPHPKTGKEITVTCVLPPDLQMVLALLTALSS